MCWVPVCRKTASVATTSHSTWCLSGSTAVTVGPRAESHGLVLHASAVGRENNRDYWSECIWREKDAEWVFLKTEVHGRTSDILSRWMGWGTLRIGHRGWRGPQIFCNPPVLLHWPMPNSSASMPCCCVNFPWSHSHPWRTKGEKGVNKHCIDYIVVSKRFKFEAIISTLEFARIKYPWSSEMKDGEIRLSQRKNRKILLYICVIVVNL